MDRKGLKFTTPKQFSILLQELSARPDMARGAPIFGTTKQQWEEEWDMIKMKLNSCGPPIRSTIEWRKVWSDLKGRTRKKIADNAAEIRKNNGEETITTLLTPIELEVDKILNLSRSVCRPGSLRPSSSEPHPKRRREDDECISLLRQQTINQDETNKRLDHISESLDRIADALEMLVGAVKTKLENENIDL